MLARTLERASATSFQKLSLVAGSWQLFYNQRVIPLAAASAETFTEQERQQLAPYFTNLDGHVFALTNLPETVKGALFARYSRSAKSLRRLFLDEFASGVPHVVNADTSVGLERAEKLYARVFNDYGDDSVAQLGGA